jgi:outer membrane receptor protein involved in Fe transport
MRMSSELQLSGISGAPGGHWVASLTGHNLADRRYFQSLSHAGSKNSWEGPASPPRTVFVKITYAW